MHVSEDMKQLWGVYVTEVDVCMSEIPNHTEGKGVKGQRKLAK